MFFGSKKPQDAQAPDRVAPTLEAGQQTAEPGETIFDVSVEDFETKVIKASMQQPVIIDFWAPWCGPCKQLMPVLEKAVRETGGKVLLAKVNIDENQQLAAALRVQSVPTVFAFFQGQPVDAFQGNQPESQIKAFVSKLSEIARQAQPDALDIPEALKGAAQALAENEVTTAHAIYTQILKEDQKNTEAYAGMIRTFIAAGQIDLAQEMISSAPEDMQKQDAFKQAQTALELATAKPDGSLDEYEDKLKADENDHQARFDLAVAQFSNGEKEEAIGNLLYIIEKDREWNEDGARAQLLKFFEAMGHADPLTVQGRKKLSSILFS